jgi:anti-sigma B factor antagonist
MNFTIERRNKIAIFGIKHNKLNSELAPKFKAELLIVCQPDIDALIIDLTDVESIESAGLGGLLLAHRQLDSAGIPVVLVGVQPMVLTLLSISQIEPLFDFFDTIDEAVESIEAALN